VTYAATADLSATSWNRDSGSALLDAQLDITYDCTACGHPQRPIEIQGLQGDGSWHTLATQTFQDLGRLDVEVPYRFQEVRVVAPTVQTDAYTTYATVVSNSIPASKGTR
jgi:hypothetical protein